MANSSRGSVALQAGDMAYTVSFSVNALCELEDAFGVTVQKIGAIFDKEASMKDVRKLARCALSDHHPAITDKEAGKVVTDAGLPVFMDAVQKAFQLAFPEVKDKANPPAAKASDH
jgi:hypothetical protein